MTSFDSISQSAKSLRMYSAYELMNQLSVLEDLTAEAEEDGDEAKVENLDALTARIIAELEQRGAI